MNPKEQQQEITADWHIWASSFKQKCHLIPPPQTVCVCQPHRPGEGSHRVRNRLSDEVNPRPPDVPDALSETVTAGRRAEERRTRALWIEIIPGVEEEEESLTVC